MRTQTFKLRLSFTAILGAIVLEFIHRSTGRCRTSLGAAFSSTHIFPKLKSFNAAFLALLLGATVLPVAHAATPLDLPSLDALVDYKPKIPLRVYSSDNVLIG